MQAAVLELPINGLWHRSVTSICRKRLNIRVNRSRFIDIQQTWYGHENPRSISVAFVDRCNFAGQVNYTIFFPGLQVFAVHV